MPKAEKITASIPRCPDQTDGDRSDAVKKSLENKKSVTGCPKDA
jgi:hypothetical protein